VRSNVSSLSALSGFAHEKSDVVLHRDEALMPKEKSDWSPLNVFSYSKIGECMCTIWQNSVQPDIKENLFQTWNPCVWNPKPDTILVGFYVVLPSFLSALHPPLPSVRFIRSKDIFLTSFCFFHIAQSQFRKTSGDIRITTSSGCSRKPSRYR
jgi:hypothetical protein